MLGGVVQQAANFVGVVGGNELYARLLEVGQPLEVVGEVAAHLNYAHIVALGGQREVEVVLGNLHTFGHGGLGEELAGVDEVATLTEYPWTAIGGTANHYTIDTIVIEHLLGLRT